MVTMASLSTPITQWRWAIVGPVSPFEVMPELTNSASRRAEDRTDILLIIWKQILWPVTKVDLQLGDWCRGKASPYRRS